MAIVQRKEAIEMRALQILKEFDLALAIGAPKAIPIEEIIELKYGLTIEYHHIKKNLRVLGMTVFEDGFVPLFNTETGEYGVLPIKAGTIIIDSRLLDPKHLGRLRFTLAHELAHWIMHHELYSSNCESAAFAQPISDDLIEWSANVMGTALLMPIGRVKSAFHKLGNRNEPKKAIKDLSELFGVSCQAMEIRMKALGLLF